MTIALRAVLLDRDGVINEPVASTPLAAPESPYRPEDVRLVPGVVELLHELAAHDVPVAVVSNQPAAAKGTHTLEELSAVDAEVRRQLADRDVVIPIWEYCFHHPDGDDPVLGRACSCRKPAPGMLEAALAALRVPAGPDVWMIGDSDVDIAAGEALGLTTVLVEHPLTAHRRTGVTDPTTRVASTGHVSTLIRDHAD